MKFREQDYIVHQDFDVASLDYEKVNKYIIGLELFAQTSKKCFFIFDYYKHNYLYLKTYSEYFNDYSVDIEEPYLFFNKKLHPEDIDFVHEIHYRVFKYVFSLNIEERKNLQLFYNCRMKNKSELFVMTNVSLKIIELDSNGNIWLVLFVIEKSYSENYIIPFIENSTKDYRQFTFNQDILQNLSNIEKEVAMLLFTEIKIYEIAELMFKSPYTIKSHIQKLFKKAKAKNRLDFQRKLLCK